MARKRKIDMNIVSGKIANVIPVDAMRSEIEYDPETGVFYSKRLKRILGTMHNKGYWTFGFRGTQYLAHRVAWAMVNGEVPACMSIDHVNGVRTDNRIKNLRLATAAENSRNQGLKQANTSGFKGACFDRRKGKWMAHITVNSKFNFLGYFGSASDAHDAYVTAAARLHGEFARAA
jgi:hypothetical protein